MAPQINSVICKWQFDSTPYHPLEVQIQLSGNDLQCVLFNNQTQTICSEWTTAVIPAQTLFDRCVWKGMNDSGIDGRLFSSNSNSSNAFFVALNKNNKTISGLSVPHFETHLLNDSYPDLENGEFTWRNANPVRSDVYDGVAETGMIRIVDEGLEKCVKVWPNLTGGKNDLRLIKKTTGTEKNLILKVFRHLDGVIYPVKVNPNSEDTIIENDTFGIEERIQRYNAYPSATLTGTKALFTHARFWNSDDTSDIWQTFYNGENLETAQPDQIATYIRENLLVVKNESGNVIAESEYRHRVEVERVKDHDFPTFGKLDAIHIKIAKNVLVRATTSLLKFFYNFFAGLFNRNAPAVHQINDANRQEIEDYLTSNHDSATYSNPDERVRMIKELDRVLDANARIEYWISTDRKIGYAYIGGTCHSICSAGVTLGRFPSKLLGISCEDVKETATNANDALRSINSIPTL